MIKPQLGTDSVVLEATASAGTDQGTTTASLDTIGADYATLRVAFSEEINTNAVGPTILVQHGDGTTFTTLSTRAAEDLSDPKVITYHVDMRGKHRYLKMLVTPATASNDNITVSAIGTLYRQVEGPGATTDMATVGVVL